jgi:hypothetical protein
MAENEGANPARGAGLPRGAVTAAVVLAICLGCVVALILGILDVVAKNQSGIDISGAANLRAYATAQEIYRKTDRDGGGTRGYAHPFARLHSDTDKGGQMLMLIDRGFVAAGGPAGRPKHYHLFQECRTIGGRPIDWTTDYAMCAIPAPYGKGGRRTFIVSTDGVVWGKDLGKGTKFVDDFPADPEAAGWQEAD